jgi:hypothetical protein
MQGRDEFFLILETSGSGGWHLYIITKTMRPVEEWTRMLKQVAAFIGASIKKGVCEIFPPDGEGDCACGTALRAPGTFNGKTGNFSLIHFENTKPLLAGLPSMPEAGGWKASAIPNNPYYKEEQLCSGACLIKEGGKITAEQAAALAGKLNLDLAGARITEGGRHAALRHLVGETFPKVGRTLAEALAEHHFEQAGGTQDCRDYGEHHAEFMRCWQWMTDNAFLPSLTAEERAIYDKLPKETWRDAFRIVRNFAWAAALAGRESFPVSVGRVAEGVLLSRKAAQNVREELAERGAIRKVRPHIQRRRAAEFVWLPCSRELLAGAKAQAVLPPPAADCLSCQT